MACEACVTIPPVAAEYNPIGSTEKQGDLSIYVTGSGSKGLIYVPDIFGVTPQALQVCDKLAATGFVVGFPDVLHGKPWPMENFPPADRSELMNWVGQYTYDKVKQDIEATIEVLKAKGAQRFGIVGFCWGGKISTLAAKEDYISASAAAHPSFLTNEDADLVKVPILLLPSKDEPDLTEFISIVKSKGIAASQVRFDDMHHGWMAARGDWSKPDQAKRATEGIQLLASFFMQYL